MIPYKITRHLALTILAVVIIVAVPLFVAIIGDVGDNPSGNGDDNGDQGCSETQVVENVKPFDFHDVGRLDLSKFEPEELEILPLVPERCKKKCPAVGDLAWNLDGVCTCLSPCKKVCRSFSITCNGEYGVGSIWETLENKRCYEIEQVQNSSRLFLRTTCRCPVRNYNVSDPCVPEAQASLKNCILGKISANYEINFGRLESVQLGHVRTIGADVDFQGEVSYSHFCHIDAGEDIEFGGGMCPIQFHENSVMKLTTEKDLQFEWGTWIGPSNTFGRLKIGDDIQFVQDDGNIRNTEIFDNHWASLDVDDKCNYKMPESNITTSGNSCGVFVLGDDSACDPTVFGGFDCV